MSLELPDLESLDPTAVGQVQDQLFALLAEAFPDVELRRGVVSDVVLHLAAALLTAEQTQIDLLRQSQSLLAISENPTGADDTTVDAILSNFRVTRLGNTAATGQVTVVLSALLPVVIPKGAQFTAGTQTFSTEAAYAVRVSAATVTSPTDRVLVGIGGGNYAFTIPVVADQPGVAGMLRQGTTMVPSFPLPHFAGAFATADFAGGFDAESNADLIARLQAGVATRAWSNRASIDAMIHAQPDFERCLQVSIIGYGDGEMPRDRHTIFPVALGGRSDVYARTATLPLAVALVKQATLIALTPTGGVWQFGIDVGDAPGFYLVTRVALPAQAPDEAGFTINSDVRTLDLTGQDWVPDIATPEEGAYSSYQAAVIQFTDDQTPTGGLTVGTSTAPYAVSVLALPQVADLQQFLGGRGVRNPAGDVLVKAPVPCFLSVSFEVRCAALAADSVDTAAIAAAVAAKVNDLGYCGTLYTSTVAEVVGPYLPDGAALGAIDLFGRIRRPDGQYRFIRDPLHVAITVPDDPERLTTARTVCFFLDPADVAVMVRVVDVPEI
jgi:uncharacterized phage protein gp47/JayE